MILSDEMCKTYNRYEDFIADFIKHSMEYGVSFLIVNWEDALGVCHLLNTYTINGASICIKGEFISELYNDIKIVKEHNGNMIITLFDSGEMICEKALDKESAYVDDAIYFVEYSANELALPLHAKVSSFKIESNIFDNTF